jgi:hypothetical protein
MVFPADPLGEALSDILEGDFEEVVVYGDPDGETVLHEGPARIRANGWVELSSGRLLSPAAVHHVDPRSGA